MTVKEFCGNLTALEGTPYNQCDCIGLVRRAAHINCQGTNWLWRSYKNSSKYRYLVRRETSPPSSFVPGLLVFRVRWNETPKGYDDTPNCYHVGVLLYDGKVIQSQEKTGVHISPFNPSEWQACGWLKQIEEAPAPAPAPDIPPVPDNYPSDREILIALYNKFILQD